MARSLAVSCDMCVVCVDEEEEGYVCECCDPAKKKKGSESSGENSELEQDEAIGPEVRYIVYFILALSGEPVVREGQLYSKMTK